MSNQWVEISSQARVHGIINGIVITLLEFHRSVKLPKIKKLHSQLSHRLCLNLILIHCIKFSKRVKWEVWHWNLNQKILWPIQRSNRKSFKSKAKFFTVIFFSWRELDIIRQEFWSKFKGWTSNSIPFTKSKHY